MKKTKIIILLLIFGFTLLKAQEPYIGEIRIFAGNFAPRGWAKCDGQLMAISQNEALFSLIGTIYGGDGYTTFGLPDLRGRIPIHMGQGPGLPNFNIGSKGGQETVTLTVNEMPSHNHTLNGSDAEGTDTDPTNKVIARTSSGLPIYGNQSTEESIATQNKGDNQAHSNMQPFINCTYIIALTGIYPSRDKEPDDVKSEPYLGEIKMFAFNFAPRSWAKCDGQILPINMNQSLFSLLGTNYGGDGRTTFGLPDLRGRTPIHLGSSGGQSHSLGSKSGESTHTLSTNEFPSHNHGISASTFPGDSTDPQNKNFADNGTIPSYSENSNITLSSSSVGNLGGNQAHENKQPYLTINFCIALNGIFPSMSKSDSDVKSTDPFIGEICIFPYTFAPRNFLDCSGQLLQIAQNTALFSLVGTTYGGDGQTTFGIPNIQGRTVMNWGNGPGLTPKSWGEYGGTETVTLTESQMPSHNHMLRYSPIAEYQSPEGRYYSTHQFNNFSSDANTFLSTSSIGNNGGSYSHNNMQPYLTLRFCIATSGIYPSRKEEIIGGNNVK